MADGKITDILLLFCWAVADVGALTVSFKATEKSVLQMLAVFTIYGCIMLRDLVTPSA